MNRCLLPLVFLAACDVEFDPMKVETPPLVTILTPEEDVTVEAGTAVFFSGKVEDDEPYENLQIGWESDLDGVLAEVEADADGYVELTTANLNGGVHVIRLYATDSNPLTGDDTVTVTVDGDIGAPVLTVIHPEVGETGRQDTPFAFEAEVVDSADAPEDIEVSMSSDLDGPICVLDPAGGVAYACDEVLTTGIHTLTFLAVDSDGKEASVEVAFTVLRHTEIDDDLDGFTEEQGDCDDDAKKVHPGADEVLNAIDDDCDGLVDEGTEGYDDDGDGYTELQDDCDDADADIYPTAPELEDGKDNDCDGIIDEGTPGYDDDRDGWTENQGDCDDADPLVNPGLTEVCDDGLDNDCSGVENDEDAIGCKTWYQDVDGDAYGLDEACLCEKDPVTDFDAKDGGDCDDSDKLVNPGAVEIPYDGIDNDCLDGDIQDVDGDGYSAEIAGGTDCDDYNPDVNPSEVELPDGLDQDCDRMLDEGTELYDDDGDGFCDADSAPCTLQPNQTVPWENKDCDDGDKDVNPDAEEVCSNGLDDNCSGEEDEDNALGCDLYYLDSDFDGFGHPTSSRCLCGTDPIYDVESPLNTDCDDNSKTVNPAALEAMNRLDDDCDGLADEETDWYDDDGDGYCETSTTTCTEQSWQTDPWPGGDCDDTVTGVDVNPGELEVCSNGVDDNCSGAQDEANASGCSVYNKDADGDDYGLYGDTQCLCAATTTYDVPGPVTTSDDDCDDTLSTVHPNATETGDRLDNDCDGLWDEGTTWYDDDGDGYCEDSPCTKQPSQSSAWPSGDCDDTSSNAYWVNPGRSEVCNDGLDNNCKNGQDEEGAQGSTKYYRDGDGDGYGHETDYKNLCSASSSYDETDNDDCNDSNNSVKPTATWQTTSDGTVGWDYNCNNVTDKYYTSSTPYDCYLSVDWSTWTVYCYYTSGWEDGLPSCGGSDDYLSGCTFNVSWTDILGGNLDLCDPTSTSLRTQKCR